MLPLLTFKELKQVVTDIHITRQYVTMSDPISYMPWMVKKDNDDCYQCEMCGRSMDKVDYDYCDICGDCLE